MSQTFGSSQLTNLFLFSWDDSFYLGGVFIALSGLLAWIMGPIHAEDHNNNNNDDANSFDDPEGKDSKNEMSLTLPRQ